MKTINSGDKASPFDLNNQEGRNIRLSDFIGKKLFLYFLIDENKSIENTWYKISPKNTVPELIDGIGLK